MSGDEIGPGRHADDERSGRPPRPSVFEVPDQGDVIARIDAVSEDDLGSTFFGHSIQDVENAATWVFDIGVRTLSDDGATTPSGTFGVPAPGPAMPSSTASPAVRMPGLLDDDPVRRGAFILGGPAALRSA